MHVDKGQGLYIVLEKLGRNFKKAAHRFSELMEAAEIGVRMRFVKKGLFYESVLLEKLKRG